MRAVDAAQALAELREVSSEIEAAVIGDDKGNVVAATADGETLADAGRSLLEQAVRVRRREPAQLDVATDKGSVFVVRDNGLTIVATTAPEPAAGLVFYDLKTCLRAVEAPKPKRRRAKQKEPGDQT